MTTKRMWAVVALIALGSGTVACGSDSGGGASSGSGGALASGGSPSSGGAVSSGGSPSGGGAPGAGGAATGGASAGGAPACPSSGGSTADSGSAEVPDAGADASADGSVPLHPYVRAGAIGVTDLEKASTFLTDVLSMTQEGADVTRDDRVERTFWAKEADRGSRVVLMKFDDGRSTKDITAKIVFQAKDVKATYQKAIDAGYASILPPIPLGSLQVSQVKGPEGYTVEILSGLDPAGADIEEPYFIALAFGVTDFCAARKFYANALGMIETVPYSDNDLQEMSMEYPTGGGAGLVLQHYQQTTHVYKDNPVKHVSFVPDVAAFTSRVEAAGGKLVRAPAVMPAYDGKLGAILKDPDGYEIELVQAD